MTKKKGWRREPARHSLAARGIKTKKSNYMNAKLPITSEYDQEALYVAEVSLLKAGVSFDTGQWIGEQTTRDWELDWSLDGAWVDKDGKMHIPTNTKNEQAVFDAEFVLRGAKFLDDDDIEITPDEHVWNMGKWANRRVV